MSETLGKQPDWATILVRARAKAIGEYRDEFDVSDSDAVATIDEYLDPGESAKAAVLEEIALPFVSSSELIDKISHAQELIESLKPATSGLPESLRHAVETLDEVIEMLPGWLFAPAENR